MLPDLNGRGFFCLFLGEKPPNLLKIYHKIYSQIHKKQLKKQALFN